MINNTTESILIGRAVKLLYPEIADELLAKITPQSDDKKHIPLIWEYVANTFDELDATDKNTLFIAIIYKIYAPASLIGKSVGKLPTGIRSKVSGLINQKSPEMVNHFLGFAKANLKNPRYLKKVQAIIDDILSNEIF